MFTEVNRTATGLALLKKQIVSVDKDVEKLEPLYTTKENAKCAVTLENSLAVLKSFYIVTTVREHACSVVSSLLRPHGL